MSAERDALQDYFVTTFPAGPLQCNCTIIGHLPSNEAVVIDPGGNVQTILNILAQHGFTLTRILHTHGHFDHIMAAGQLQEHTGAPTAIHEGDRWLWDNLKLQCERFHIPFTPLPPPTEVIDDEAPITLGNHACGTCIYTPGHTPGSVSFAFNELKLLLAGDTLFRRSIGRTDLWGGDFSQIEHSIRNKLYALDEAMTVITGHGPSTTLADEIRHNPVVRGVKR